MEKIFSSCIFCARRACTVNHGTYTHSCAHPHMLLQNDHPPPSPCSLFRSRVYHFLHTCHCVSLALAVLLSLAHGGCVSCVFVGAGGPKEDDGVCELESEGNYPPDSLPRCSDPPWQHLWRARVFECVDIAQRCLRLHFFLVFLPYIFMLVGGWLQALMRGCQRVPRTQTHSVGGAGAHVCISVGATACACTRVDLLRAHVHGVHTYRGVCVCMCVRLSCQIRAISLVF